jgi:hypothetical protein
VDPAIELSRHMKTTGNQMIPVFLPVVVDELGPAEEGRDRDVAVLLHSAQADSTQSSPFTRQVEGLEGIYDHIIQHELVLFLK